MNTKGLFASGQLALMVVLQLESGGYAFANSVQLLTPAGSHATPSAGGGGDSGAPIVTPDGRFVVFASRAKNLLSPASNPPGPESRQASLDVFLRDRTKGITTLVSADVSTGKGGNGDSLPLAISTNGQYVLLESSANNLVAGDTNGATDVFIRDVTAGKTLVVSANTNGLPGNAISRKATMTPDGKFVAFLSSATDLIFGDTNNLPDVFVRDMVSGVTRLASVDTGRSAGPSSEPPIPELLEPAPEITPDGQSVAFQQTTRPFLTQIFVRDLLAQTTLTVSTEALALVPSILGSTNPCRFDYAISDDSKYVVFEASPIGSDAGVVFRYGLANGNTELVYTNAAYLSDDDRSLDLSSNGQIVVFVGNSNGSTGDQLSVLRWDGQSGAVTLVSSGSNHTATAGTVSCNPALTPDGRFVAFVSDAPDLVSNTPSAGFHLYVQDTVAGTMTLVDGTPEGENSGLTGMVVASLSADGRIVVFDAGDSNLVPNDNNHSADIFLRDLTSGTTELISARAPELPSLSGDASSELWPQALSSEGRFLVFSSSAANLVDNDTNGFIDVFVRDLVTGSNTLVSTSLASDGADGPSADPAISGDGRYVAFDSSADNLVTGDTNHAWDVFVRDLQTGTTVLASVNADGTGPGNGDSFLSGFSANGRYVLFQSFSTSLTSGSIIRGENLFWRDLQAGKTYALTSSGLIGLGYGSGSLLNPKTGAVMTPDGRFVFFITAAGSGVAPPGLYVWDALSRGVVYTNTTLPGSILSFGAPLDVSPDGRWICYPGTGTAGGFYALDWRANTNVLISLGLPGSSLPQFSADSRFLVYSAHASVDSSMTNQVYLWDFRYQTNLLVSRSDAVEGGANGNSGQSAISADGHYIAYSSTASDLVPGATNGVCQLYLFDVVSGATTLVSASSFGPFGAADKSALPVLSANGGVLVFESTAADLVKLDFNSANDLFTFSVPSTNAPTPFEVTVEPGSVSPAISWPVTPSVGYRAQFKNSLSDSVWQDLSAPISIIDGRAVLHDVSPASGQRFYRIIAKP